MASATVPPGCFAVEPGPWGALFVLCEDLVAVFAGSPCVGDPDGDGFLVSAGPEL